jgi:Bacteriophage HK97-gp10, putative tail-component
MSSYNPDHLGMQRMLNADWMEDAMRQVAEDIKARAIALAPLGTERKGDMHPGRYKASFHVKTHKYAGAPGRRGSLRAEAIVYNDAPEALYVEYAHFGAEPYHTLARAAFRDFPNRIKHG